MLLKKCEILSLSHLVGRQLEIILIILLIEFTFTFMSLAICLVDLFIFLITLSQTALIIFFDRAWSSTPKTVVRFTELLKYFHNMINCRFSHLSELNNVWVYPFRAMCNIISDQCVTYKWNFYFKKVTHYTELVFPRPSGD